DGVAYALQSPFAKLFSVEVIPEIAIKAADRFTGNKKVCILEGDSVSILAQELPYLKGNCLFWLDAHFPGADAGMAAYNADADEDLRLPLERELEVISRLRSNYKDVLILDDLRIYEDGPFANGNVPADALPGENRTIEFIYRYFGDTHEVMKCYLDEGYILLFPRSSYKRNHFKWSNLFKKVAPQEDHYLITNVI
ncbi:MAG TPA: hypothetical protein VJ499_15350, partial [Flavisolibacter sp.]|nr:hypothetical protein [Flavisolibacter sp.]